MPLAKNAPNDCPAEPVNLIEIVSSGNPSKPYFLAILLESTVPVVRFTFLIGRSSCDLLALLDRVLAELDQLVVENVGEPMILFLHAVTRHVSPTSGMVSSGVRSSPLAFQ